MKFWLKQPRRLWLRLTNQQALQAGEKCHGNSDMIFTESQLMRQSAAGAANPSTDYIESTDCMESTESNDWLVPSVSAVVAGGKT